MIDEGNAAKVSLNYQRLCILAIVMLLIAVLPLPYAYYQIMRWVICACSIAFAYKYFKEKETPNTAILYGFLAALYNPIATIHLGKPLWVVVNLLTVLAFAHAYRSIKKQTPALLDEKIADRLDSKNKSLSHNDSGENNGVS